MKDFTYCAFDSYLTTRNQPNGLFYQRCSTRSISFALAYLGLLTSGSKQNNQQRRDSNLCPHCCKPPLCHVSQIIVLSCFYSHSLFTSLGRYFFEHFFLKTVLFSTKQKLPYLYFSGAQSVPSLNQCRGIKLGIGNKV